MSFQYLISYAYLLVVLGYVYGFIKNYWIGNERKKIEVRSLMVEPYKLIAAQQVIIFLGIFLIIQFRTPTAILVTIMILKIMVDMIFHFLARKKYLNVN